jgi:glutaredoxin
MEKVTSKVFTVTKETKTTLELRITAASKEEARLKIVNNEGFPPDVAIQPKTENVDMTNWKCIEEEITVDGSCKIILFISSAQPNCPYCQAAKAYFNSLGIPFKTVDLAKNEIEKNRIIEAAGNDRIPKIEVNGKVETGFNPTNLHKLLQTAEIITITSNKEIITNEQVTTTTDTA